MSQGTGEAPGGLWGRDGPRGTEPPLEHSGLGWSPCYLRQGHRGLTWPLRGRGGHTLPLWGDRLTLGHRAGDCAGISQGHPKTHPSQESSPRSQGHPVYADGRGDSSKKPPAAVGHPKAVRSFGRGEG